MPLAPLLGRASAPVARRTARVVAVAMLTLAGAVAFSPAAAVTPPGPPVASAARPGIPSSPLAARVPSPRPVADWAGTATRHEAGTATRQGVWPLTPQPRVVASFDPPPRPWQPGHRGVDLAGAPGQAVRSALAGRVSYARPLAGRGVVVVEHGDVRTTYEPVTATVQVGDAVPRGGRIGHLEWVGSHCAPFACLHWGLRSGRRYLDPLSLLGPRPVRLLPLSPP